MLSGCATPYQSAEFSFRGGYEDQKVNEHIQKIVFMGNGYTAAETVRDYALLRAAEYTKEQHMPYFLLYPDLYAIALGEPVSQVQSWSLLRKPIAYCYVQPLMHWRLGAQDTQLILKRFDQTVS